MLTRPFITRSSGAYRKPKTPILLALIVLVNLQPVGSGNIERSAPLPTWLSAPSLLLGAYLPQMEVYYSAVTGTPLFTSAPVDKWTAERYEWRLMETCPSEYRTFVIRSAILYDVPLPLLVTLIDQETNKTWDPRIVTRNSNRTFDIGLAQANSRYLAHYADKFGLLDPTNAEQSIEFVASYMKTLYSVFGDWTWAVVAYKCGESGARKVKEDSAVYGVSSSIVRRAGI